MKATTQVGIISKQSILYIYFLLCVTSLYSQVQDNFIHLPDPTGPFSVGVTTIYWSDSTRMEVMTADSSDFRQFAASVFYPGILDDQQPRAYFPNLDVFLAAFRATAAPGPRGVDRWSQSFAAVRTHAYENVPCDDSGQPFPIVFISPGGDMSRHWHTMIAQELTSHGHIVVAVSHAHSGIDLFPLGGMVKKNQYYQEAVPQLNAALTQRIKEDVIFIADRILEINSATSDHFLSGKMDPARIAIIGHSRGGRAVNHVMHSDKRFRCGIRLDGSGPPHDPKIRLSQPHLTVRIPWNKKEILKKLQHLHRTSLAPNYEVIIDGLNHFSFSDLTYVVPEVFKAAMDPEEAHRLICDLTLEFLNSNFLENVKLKYLVPDRLSRPTNMEVIKYSPK